jgi:rhamnose transport system substrate-binding protein
MIQRSPSRRRAATAAAVCALAVTLAGCGGTTKKDTDNSGKANSGSQAKANPDAPLKKGLKIAFLPKQINNPYEKIVDHGGIAAAGDFGGKGKEVGPSDASASSQVSYINTLIQQRQDAIVIAANDPNAVCGRRSSRP